MGKYKINPDAINGRAIEYYHLNENALGSITSDGVRNLGEFPNVNAIINKLGEIHGSDLTKNDIKSNIGHFVASLSDGTFFDILSNCTNPNNDIWIQSITGNLTLNNGVLKYSSDNIGTFVRKHTSVGWSAWKISNNVEITDNNSEIIKRLQGTSENNQYKDPFKTINHTPQNIIHVLNGKTEDAYGNKINLKLDDLTPYVADKKSYNTGNYRSYEAYGTSFIDLKIYALNWNNKKYMQSVFGPITCVPSTGELKWVNDLEFGEFYRISSAGKDSQGNDVIVWGKWKPVNKKEIEYIIQGEDDSCKPFNRPFKVLRKSEDSLIFSDINDVDLWKQIDGLHVYVSDQGNTEGTWRFYIGYMPIDVKVISRHYKSDLWYQSFESIYKYNKTNKRFYLDVNDIKLRTYYRNRINPDNKIVTDGMSEEEISAIINKNKWTEWSDLTDNIVEELQTNANSITNEVTRATQAETELDKRIQGISENTSPWNDSFKRLYYNNKYDFPNLSTLVTELDKDYWHGETIDDTKEYLGIFRTNVAGIPIEIFSTVVGYGDKNTNGDQSVWVQEIKGAISIDKGSNNYKGTTEKGYIDTKFEYSDDSDDSGKEWYTRTYKQGLRFVSPTNNSGIHTLRRTYNGSLGGWGEWVDSDNPYITSPLYGKNVLILGGSFAHNMQAYISNDNTGYGFDIEGRKYSLQNYIAKQLGLNRFDNFAVQGNGACISNNAFRYNIYQQLYIALECAKANNYKYDAIIFQGGINDYQANSPLGSLTDLAGDNTFYASYKKIINLARTNERSKDAKLFMTTPFKAFHKIECWKSTEQTVNEAGHRYYDYLQAIRDIAQYASIPLLDIWSIQQVDANNYGRYYRNQDGDDTHPNGQGYLQVAPSFIEFLAWGKGMETFDFNALSYNNRANIKLNSDSIDAEVTRATKAESDINAQIEDTKSEIINRLQGNSKENSVNYDPFIKLEWNPETTINNIDQLYPGSGGIADTNKATGHFRSYSTNGTSCLDIKVDVLSWANSRFMQTVSGPVTLINSNKNLYWVNGVPGSGPGYYYRLSERKTDETDLKWSEWKPVNNSYIESLQNKVNSLQQQIDSILDTLNTISIK